MASLATRIGDFIRSPFSFLFTRSSTEDRLAAYVIREHERGRALEEILDDPYVRNRCTREQEDDLWHRPRGEHVAEVGPRAGHVEHGERERGRGKRVPDEGDRSPEEEQPKLALGKWGQRRSDRASF